MRGLVFSGALEAALACASFCSLAFDLTFAVFYYKLVLSESEFAGIVTAGFYGGALVLRLNVVVILWTEVF